MKKRLLFLALSIFTAFGINAQIMYQKIIGNAHFNGNMHNEARDIQQTTDGGFIITGSTNDTASYGYKEIFLLKTNANGIAQWLKTYGDNQNDVGHSVAMAPDGGFVVTGSSQDSNFTQRAFLMKTDLLGNLQWAKFYSDSLGYSGMAYSVSALNGYIISGMTPNPSASVSAMLLSTDLNGTIVSSTGFGAAGFFNMNEESYHIYPTSDGNYLLTGFSNSFNPDSLGFAHADFYVIKTNGSNKIWSFSLGGNLEEYGYAATETTDGYVFVGKTAGSFGGAFNDVLVIKLDKNGNFLWAKRLDSGAYDDAQGVLTTTDNGVLISGRTQALPGGLFAWKLDNNGNSQWFKTYQSAYSAFDDIPAKVLATTDNGYAITGEGNYFSGAGSPTVYLIKTDSTGKTNCDTTGSVTISNVSINPVIPSDSLFSLNYTTGILSFHQISWPTLDSTFCELLTGINNSILNENTSIQLFPNPFSLSATIQVNRSEFKKLDFRMYDVHGREVIHAELRSPVYELKRGNLASGMYFYKVTNNQQPVASGKLLVSD